MMTKKQYKEDLLKLKKQYHNERLLYQEKFSRIKNGDFRRLGIDGYDYDEYYPCEFVRIVDEEDMLVEVFEPSIEKTHIESVDHIVLINQDGSRYRPNYKMLERDR